MKQIIKIFLLTAIVSLGYCIIISIFSINEEYSNLIKLENEMKMYQLSDNLIDEAEVEYFKNHDYTEIQAFYNDLKREFGSEYIYSFNQEMNIYNFKGSIDFYEFYYESIQENILEEYTINAVQVNQSAVDKYQLIATNQYSFSENDFIIQEDKVVPVILGSDFIGIYDIGEIFEGNYLPDEFKFEVKGFLAPDCEIPVRLNMPVNLNRYVVMPALEDWNHLMTPSFNKWNSLQLINGFILNQDGDMLNLIRLSELSANRDLPIPYLIGVSHPLFVLNQFIQSTSGPMICLILAFIGLIIFERQSGGSLSLNYQLLAWLGTFIGVTFLMILLLRFISLKFICFNFIFIIMLYFVERIMIMRYKKRIEI